MSDQNLSDLRGRILDMVERFGVERAAGSAFVPGETLVHYAGRVFGPRELQLLVDAALDFRLTDDRYTEEFERRLAEYTGVKAALMVSSGSSANLLAVAALTSRKLGDRRLKPGDEVITVAAAFPTTVAPLVQHRLIPVFVDVDIGGYNALPERVAAAVGARTRAIMLAHTLGNPWDVAEIGRIAREHDLWVIEDNCDALGAEFGDRRTGSFGHLATLSFYPAHHITTGEGGALLCSTEELATIAQSFRDWGRDCTCRGDQSNRCGRRFSSQHGTLPPGYDHRYVFSELGYNLKATELQAAIGCAQLDRLPVFVTSRRHNHELLLSALAPHAERLTLPRATPGASPSWFGFAVTVPPGAGFSRSDIVSFLESRRIETRNLFSGNVLRHPAFEGVEHRVVGDLGNSDRITRDTFFVGVYPGIGCREREHMIDSLVDFLARH